MSEINYQELRERYSPKPAPECPVCGEKMSVQRVSYGAQGISVVYACSGEGDYGYFKIDRTFADEHYAKSRITVRDDSDPEVLALLDELEHYKSREERVTKLVMDNSTSWDALYEKLEAAEKRIAELEAREIKPAKGEVLVVVSGFTGCGKSAIAGEIEIAMKAIGVPVQWTNGDAEKRMTGADWLTAIEMYKPTVRIVEVNVPLTDGIRIKGK
ncbi:ead/Ea22-like family protein [Escherichia coli]|uniref:ead/Ea22-like family protein n=1 Tax=Escherichia coli TaxID=562 RepID=UPI000D15ACBC|nr:ead/Ea22-like family protein [Escherichia coli]MBB9724689.1 ead/Ea22-like family protein [Escherichia coli]PSY49298.1 hypothetical protein C7B19_20640 [Escherichia coli]